MLFAIAARVHETAERSAQRPHGLCQQCKCSIETQLPWVFVTPTPIAPGPDSPISIASAPCCTMLSVLTMVDSEYTQSHCVVCFARGGNPLGDDSDRDSEGHGWRGPDVKRHPREGRVESSGKGHNQKRDSSTTTAACGLRILV